MKYRHLLLIIIKTATFLMLIISSFFVIFFYFQIDFLFTWNEAIVQMNRFWTFIYFILFFYILFYLVNPKIYLYSFSFILIIGGCLWIGLYFFMPTDLYATTFRNTITIPLFSVVSIGLSLILIQIIKSVSKKFANNKLFKKYHVHEGLLGIILIILGEITWIIRLVNIQQVGYNEKIRFFYAIYSIFIFLFYFCGSFLLFRDWRDVVHLRFIEKFNLLKKSSSTNIINSTTFNEIYISDTHFFKSPKIKLYPLGLILACFSQVALIHDNDFLPFEFFNLAREQIVFISIICIFLSGGIVGIDWYRLFAKCFPKDYTELEQILKNHNKKEKDSSSKIYVQE